MAQRIDLTIENREVTGKKVKFLRNKGVVPVHLFGHNKPSLSLQGDGAKLGKVIAYAGLTRLINLKVVNDSKDRVVMIKEVQKDPIKGNLLHVDFYEVDMNQKIRVEVPIVLVGESPALRIRENMLNQNLYSLLIECLPDKMPDRMEIDISVLKGVDQSILVKDVKMTDIVVLNDSDVQIVKIGIRPVEVVEEKPAAAAAPVEGAAPAEGAAKAETKTAAPKTEAKK
ncbi:MAG TPA: 50S ribosomal protein L25 [Dehalococcoidales bacterium]|nr:50S ribosomal protein L25 [Dehalococcoidales bacterium]